MHGNAKERRETKDLDITGSRTGGYRLSAIQRADRLGSATYILSYDRNSWVDRGYQSAKEFNYSIAVIFTSAGGIGTALGIFIQKLFGG